VRRALELDPDYVPALNRLGGFLIQRGQPDEALVLIRRAIEKNSNYGAAYHNLGAALSRQGRIEASVRAYERAVALEPKNARRHHGLSIAYEKMGDFAAALKAQQRAHELDRKNPGSVARLRQVVDLDKRIDAVLSGAAEPHNDRDALSLAWFALRYRKDRANTLRLYKRGLAAHPELAPQFRYDAACAAALAGRSAQAKVWLREELDALKKHPDRWARELAHWMRDPDLKSLRDAGGPLWTEVAELLERAR
jgi:tetratricopeptide (TPR) repeat protein